MRARTRELWALRVRIFRERHQLAVVRCGLAVIAGCFGSACNAVDTAIAVSTLPKLYKLGVAKLSALERMADKSAANLVAALERSKHTTLPRFEILKRGQAQIKRL